MLPSTGYFKAINCPFYDSGLCERPYCHFRHAKKDPQNNANEGYESGTILQQLVSEAVKKVLQHTESGAAANRSPKAVNSDPVIEVEEPQIGANSSVKVTYNPTPIAELKKINSTSLDTENQDQLTEPILRKHIPVPYTPHRPATVPSKRTSDSNGTSKPFIFNPPVVKYTPGSSEIVKLDPYLPQGSTVSNEKYFPGSETELQAYTPAESKSSSKLKYVPSGKSDKNTSNKKLLEYKPIKVGTPSSKVTGTSENSSLTYCPTPLAQVPCFSSDEDEPDIKKRKISPELNGLDDLDSEFEIIGQILDEEKPKDTILENHCDIVRGKNSENTPVIIKSNEVDRKKQQSEGKSSCHLKQDNGKSKSASHKSKSSESRKSSHKDKDRDKSKSKEKDSSNNKKSQTSTKSSKSSERSSSKSSERSSKHSSSKSSESLKHKTDNHDKKKESQSKHEKRDKHTKEKSRSSRGRPPKSKRNVTKSKDETKKELFNKNSEVNEDSINKFSDDEVIAEDNIVELADEISESDEDAIALECKKIFEEYVPTFKAKDCDEVFLPEETEECYIPSKKRVSRTADKQVKVIPRAPIKPDFRVNAAQAMAERLTKVRLYHASKDPDIAQHSSVTPKTASTNSTNTATGKIRIASVSYVSTLLNAKKNISSKPKIDKSEPSTSTIVQTVRKGTSRVAHLPNEKFIDRPGVLEPLASKIPANIRSVYLNMMIDECLKIYLTAVDAYARAQQEELNTSKKCTTVPIYKNSAVLTVSRLRKELQEAGGIKKSASDSDTHQSNTAGKGGQSASWSIVSKKRTANENTHEFKGAKFYENISKWILSEEQLQQNGFPRTHPSGEKGKAKIYVENNRQKPPKGRVRTCCRCKKEYTVDKKNLPARKEECIYHPNNKYRVRGEVRYQCCSQDNTSDGCCVAPCHVWEYVDYENLKGYVKTLPPAVERDDGDYGVYALDCEMCYTTQGLDLTRVTIIDSSCKVVYETLIKPLHTIVDYNTRYSGITEEQMAGITTTLLDVQATLLTMFSSKTILIGHSLESDFKALKLIHDTVIDTSVLFPHKMGPPYKRALRNLSSEHLRKIIQNSVDGHDSAEDATVCMELIYFKLKEELKLR